MAQENGYQRQVGPSSPVGLPSASPAAFGAGIGAAADELGQSIGRAKLNSMQIERRLSADAQASDAAVRMAEARLAVSRARDDARANPSPYGAGHEEAMATAFDASVKGLAESITDQNVRRSVMTQIADQRASFLAGEHAWQVGMAAKTGVDNIRQAGDNWSAYARTSNDPDALKVATQSINNLVDSMTNLGEHREPVRREMLQRVTVASAQRMRDEAPQALIATIDAGGFNDILDGEQLTQLRRGAEATLNAQAAQARAEAAHQAQVKRDELAAREEVLNAGGGTYQDRVNLAQEYAGLGDKSKATHWLGDATQFVTKQSTMGLTPAQLTEKISTLQGKQQRGGLTGGEANELQALQKQLSETTTRLSGEGGALAQLQYATGRTLAPIAPANPASFRTRAQQAIAAAQSFGRATVEPLQASELPGLKDLVEKGPGSKLQALQMIQQFGDPRAIAGAARQIAGADDGDFRIAATLSQLEVQRDVLAGADALKSAPGVYKADKAAAVMQNHYARTLGFLPAGYREDVMAAARNLFAQRMVRTGQTAWNPESSPGQFAAAIETVMGRTVGRDGQVRGGIARTPQGIVVTPSTMSPAQMLQRFARANNDDYARASGGRVPRWPDGRAITRGQFREFLPTAIGGGRYVFRNRDGGVILDDRHSPYTVDIAGLPAR